MHARTAELRTGAPHRRLEDVLLSKNMGDREGDPTLPDAQLDSVGGGGVAEERPEMWRGLRSELRAQLGTRWDSSADRWHRCCGRTGCEEWSTSPHAEG